MRSPATPPRETTLDRVWCLLAAGAALLLGPYRGGRYATFFVELDGFTFRFASLAELDHCVEILSQRVLPTSRRLSEIRGTGYGPNNHWLSRLPKGTKTWKHRQKAVAYLGVARNNFTKQVGDG
jgi:hypothetical protein